jgi:hypothetical protein
VLIQFLWLSVFRFFLKPDVDGVARSCQTDIEQSTTNRRLLPSLNAKSKNSKCLSEFLVVDENIKNTRKSVKKLVDYLENDKSTTIVDRNSGKLDDFHVKREPQHNCYWNWNFTKKSK